MTQSHYCVTHDAIFFKKGNMRGFAHPILDEKGDATGKWCNEPKQEEPQETPAEKVAPPVMSKDDWAEKDRVTRKSIERQKSLELALRVVELSGVKTKITENAIATAKSFEAYLEGKEVQPRKSKLVEEAEKLGGEEKVEP